MVDSRVNHVGKKKKLKPFEHYLLGIHTIMRKYGGYKLEDVMNLYITEFYGLIKLISYESHLENEANEKAMKKAKKGRR